MAKNIIQNIYENNNILDYVLWRGDLKMTESHINKVDMAIFAELAMLDLKGVVDDIDDEHDGISIIDAKKKYFSSELSKDEKLGLILPDSILLLFKKIAYTRRFSHLLLSDYLEFVSEEEETQVSALTIQIDEHTYCVAFSGTDDSIIGWKEDFDMLYKYPIPSQNKSLKYLETVMNKYPHAKFYVCGHSKGGNMAIYSSFNVDDKKFKRISHIYNFDGPGFPKESIDDEKYLSRLHKVTTILPQSSTIGKLFEHREKIEIVKSLKNGLYQHDVFSWEVKGKDFVYEKELTEISKKVDAKIREIVDVMSKDELKVFVQNSYKVLSYTKASNLRNLSERKRKIIEGYMKLTKEEKKTVIGPLRKFFADKQVRKVVFDSFREYLKINKVKVDLNIEEEAEHI